MTGEPCAVNTCTRVRRDGRPICNRCMRRVGESVVHRWFGYKRAVAQHPDVALYETRLRTVEYAMVLNAAMYQQIRDTGQRPRWNAARERWENPRTAARTIIYQFMGDNYGVNITDANLDPLVTALFPAET